MRVPSIALVATVVALAGLAPACGGSVFTEATTGGGDAGTTDAAPGDAGPGPADGGGLDGFPGDGSPTPWSPVCPETLPAVGSPCSQENAQCEYGSAWWSVSCDQVVQCENGAWSQFEPSFEPCQAQPGPNSAACPSDYASVPQGTACSTDGLSCIYTEGECSCQVPLEGPIAIDGGTGFWGCVPEQGCPFPRARLGSPCPGSDQTDCTYEACSYAQTCENGVWQAQEEACAGLANGGGPGQ